MTWEADRIGSEANWGGEVPPHTRRWLDAEADWEHNLPPHDDLSHSMLPY